MDVGGCGRVWAGVRGCVGKGLGGGELWDPLIASTEARPMPCLYSLPCEIEKPRRETTKRKLLHFRYLSFNASNIAWY